MLQKVEIIVLVAACVYWCTGQQNEWATTGQRIYRMRIHGANKIPYLIISLVNHCVVNQFVSIPLCLEALEKTLLCMDLATAEPDPYQRLEGIRGSTCVKWILLRTSALKTVPLAKTNNNMDMDGMGGMSDCYFRAPA